MFFNGEQLYGALKMAVLAGEDVVVQAYTQEDVELIREKYVDIIVAYPHIGECNVIKYEDKTVKITFIKECKKVQIRFDLVTNPSTGMGCECPVFIVERLGESVEEFLERNCKERGEKDG